MPSKTDSFLPILVILVFVFELSVINSAIAGPYVVEGFTLGQKVSARNANYKLYQCEQWDFDDLTSCKRTEPRRTSVGSGLFSSTVMHDDDGTALYLMVNLAPISIDRNSAEKEIEQLSKELKEPPTKVVWARPELPSSVIALWGNIELQQLNRVEVESIANDEPLARRGILVDTLGDPTRSAKRKLPVYRITGGAGYLYAASFDANARGHRHYAAIDLSLYAIPKFQAALRDILQEDQPRANDDYELWPRVAEATRNLALDTSPQIANESLDKVLSSSPSQKFRSHVWSILPLSSLGFFGLAEYSHWKEKIYGPNTLYPDIRRTIQDLLAKSPTEPFSEFLYYTIGEFDKAVQVNHNSVIKSVINYAAGYQILETLLQDIRKVVHVRISDRTPVNDTLMELNHNVELYENNLLGTLVPNFARLAAAAKPYFETVLRDQSSALTDDAAYMLGWLAFHQGKFNEALNYTCQAIGRKQNIPNGSKNGPDGGDGEEGDYDFAARRLLARILVKFPVNEQTALIKFNPVLAKEPALWWYVVTRDAYRNLNYKLTMEIGQKALEALSLPIDRLPVTTDSEQIKEALGHISVREQDLEDAAEIIYLIEASREILDYEKYLKMASAGHPDNIAKRARAVIVKYSLLIDGSEKAAQHKDLRQAVHLIEMTLDNVPKEVQHAKLREWLYYRKIRNLAQFNPKAVSEAVAAMEREFPKSQLMDDALAEQIYAEGVRMENINAARGAFQKLVSQFPTGSAVDNAYNWMAIAYHCAGLQEDARRINGEIIRRFPATRHANYARGRLRVPPEAGNCSLSIFSLTDAHDAPRRLHP